MKSLYAALKITGLGAGIGLAGLSLVPGKHMESRSDIVDTGLVQHTNQVKLGVFSGRGHREVNTPKAFDLLRQSQKLNYGSEMTPMTYLGLGTSGDDAALNRISQFEKWAELASTKGQAPVLGLEAAPGMNNFKLNDIFSSGNKELQALQESFKRLHGKGVNVRVRFLSESNLRSNPWSAYQDNGIENYKKAARYFKKTSPENVKLGFSPAIGGQGQGMDPLSLYEPGVYDYIGGTMYSTFKDGKTPSFQYGNYYNKMKKVAPNLPYQIDEFGSSVFHKSETLDFIKSAKGKYSSLDSIMLFDMPMKSNSAKAAGMLGFSNEGKSFVSTVLDEKGGSVLNVGQKKLFKSVITSVEKATAPTISAEVLGSASAAALGTLGLAALRRRRKSRNRSAAELSTSIERPVQPIAPIMEMPQPVELPRIEPKVEPIVHAPIAEPVSRQPRIPEEVKRPSYKHIYERKEAAKRARKMGSSREVDPLVSAASTRGERASALKLAKREDVNQRVRNFTNSYWKGEEEIKKKALDEVALPNASTQSKALIDSTNYATYNKAAVDVEKTIQESQPMLNKEIGEMENLEMNNRFIGGMMSQAGASRGSLARGFTRGFGRAEAFAGRSFNAPFNMGRMSYGRAGLAGGLGLLAVSQGANVMDRVRHRDYGGALLSTAVAGAAGYGAYAVAMGKGALRSHLRNAASFLTRNLR